MSEQLTYMTDEHKQMIKLLEAAGYELMEERDFPPYRVDIYLPDYHAAIEVDGPQHSEVHDLGRDLQLSIKYGLSVRHVNTDWLSSKDRQDYVMIKTREFLRREAHTSKERLAEAKDRLPPWL